MALSALQGNSRVTWTRRFWLIARLSAWRDIPELAASDIMATFCGYIINTSILLIKIIMIGTFSLRI